MQLDAALHELNGGNVAACGRFRRPGTVAHASIRCYAYAPVRRLKTIIALMMLAMWMPATSHALLEYAELIHQHHADGESDTDNDHTAADGICVPPDGGGHWVKYVATHSLSFAAIDVIFIAPAEVSKGVTDVGGLGTSPPLLKQSWQFLFRAAVPGRAPSIA